MSHIYIAYSNSAMNIPDHHMIGAFTDLRTCKTALDEYACEHKLYDFRIERVVLNTTNFRQMKLIKYYVVDNVSRNESDDSLSDNMSDDASEDNVSEDNVLDGELEYNVSDDELEDDVSKNGELEYNVSDDELEDDVSKDGMS